MPARELCAAHVVEGRFAALALRQRSCLELALGKQSPGLFSLRAQGAVAQLGERLLCKQEVIGSIPFTSTISSEVAGCPAPAGQDDDRKSGKDSFSRAPALGSCMRLFVIVNRFA